MSLRVALRLAYTAKNDDTAPLFVKGYPMQHLSDFFLRGYLRIDSICEDDVEGLRGALLQMGYPVEDKWWPAVTTPSVPFRIQLCRVLTLCGDGLTTHFHVVPQRVSAEDLHVPLVEVDKMERGWSWRKSVAEPKSPSNFLFGSADDIAEQYSQWPPIRPILTFIECLTRGKSQELEPAEFVREYLPKVCTTLNVLMSIVRHRENRSVHQNFLFCRQMAHCIQEAPTKGVILEQLRRSGVCHGGKQGLKKMSQMSVDFDDLPQREAFLRYATTANDGKCPPQLIFVEHVLQSLAATEDKQGHQRPQVEEKKLAPLHRAQLRYDKTIEDMTESEPSTPRTTVFGVTQDNANIDHLSSKQRADFDVAEILPIPTERVSQECIDNLCQELKDSSVWALWNREGEDTLGKAETVILVCSLCNAWRDGSLIAEEDESKWLVDASKKAIRSMLIIEVRRSLTICVEVSEAKCSQDALRARKAAEQGDTKQGDTKQGDTKQGDTKQGDERYVDVKMQAESGATEALDLDARVEAVWRRIRDKPSMGKVHMRLSKSREA